MDVRWEGGDNLLGDDAILALEGQTGENGCDPESGIADTSLEMAACKRTWRFFNINGAGERVLRRVDMLSGGGGLVRMYTR